jgi:hypothetical protein
MNPKDIAHNPRHCDEQPPQYCVQLQQQQCMQASEVAEGYRTKSRNIPSQPAKQYHKGQPHQCSTGATCQWKEGQASIGTQQESAQQAQQLQRNYPSQD